jgi:drug/metabolite transporter (DMT)-like permease
VLEKSAIIKAQPVASKQKIAAILGLLTGAAVWGVMWFPYRLLAQAGIGGVWATLLTYSVALSIGLLLSGAAWREWRVAGWSGIILVLGSGWANFGYVLATLNGEVMRVLLLFYLAPLWTVFFAHFLLGERLNRYGYGVVALSLSGALVMLWHADLGLPLPQNSAEWIALSSGMAFALTNVLVRSATQLSVGFKSVAIWFGTLLVSAFALPWQNDFHSLPQLSPALGGMILAIGVVLCLTSFAVQYGLTHTPANQAIVIFLFELVFAAIAAYFLVGEKMSTQEMLGALLIVSASLLSGKMPANK